MYRSSEGGGGFGQNLAASGSSDPSGDASSALAQAITDMWYNGEITSFPSDSYGQANPGGDFESYGHFTQTVWAGTQQVGCYTNFCASGTIFDGMGAWFTVCNYFPAGMFLSSRLPCLVTNPAWLV